MTGNADDVVGHFRLGYQALTRFPIVIAPSLVMAVVGFVLFFVIGGGFAAVGALTGGVYGGGGAALAGGIAGFLLGALVFGVVMGILWLLAAGMVVVMARDALAGREPVLSHAFGAVVRRLGAVAVAWVLVMVIVTIGLLFFVIPGVVAGVLFMFTLPAVLLDGLGGVDAMRRSSKVVRQHPGPVVGLVVGGLLVLVGVAIASWILHLVPLLGGLASFVLHGAVASYFTVLLVHYYRLLGTP